MCLGATADFFKAPKPILSASEEFARRLRLVKSIVKSSLTSKSIALKWLDAFDRYYSRRDGSPFMNLLMCAPLCDSRGTIRYFIGAQVDVSGLVKECSDMESFRRLVNKSELSESRED